MIMEGIICRYLNKCLIVFCNEHGTHRVAMEGTLMLLYAWNSGPIIGTDISRSLLVVGRKFSFPIYFCTFQHQILTSTPLRVSYFIAEQAHFLTCSRAIARKLIHAHRAYHCEYINQRRPDPHFFCRGWLFLRQTLCEICQTPRPCWKAHECIHWTMVCHR